MNIQFQTIFPTVGMIIAILAMDAVWLYVRKQYHDTLFYNVQRRPIRLNYAAGLVVYILLAVALFHAAVEKAVGIREATMCGAAIGFFLYGFYDMTNMATLSGWTWHMAFTDIAWGSVVSAAGSAIGYMLWKHTNRIL
jgi:uncharacterized membrane protein